MTLLKSKSTVNFCIATMAILVASCGGGSDANHQVNVTVEGAAGKTIYFDKFVDNVPAHLDSAVIDANGKATLEIPSLPMDFYLLSISPTQNCLIAIDSTQQLSLSTTLAAYDRPTSIEGSATTKRIHEFYAHARSLEEESDSLRTYLQTNNQDLAAIERYNALNKEYYDYCKQFVMDDPSSPAVLPAMNKLNRQTEIDLAVLARENLKKTMGGSDFYKTFSDEITRIEQQAQAQKLQEEQQAKLTNLMPIGGLAPDFKQATPDGKEISLSDLRGKVVLIDFWASWCKPCRIENPNVVKAYNKYKPKGFEILGVSLDRQKEAWVNAIKQDGLTWKHCSDLQFWNNSAAQAYGISSIPHTVLIDREGKIIAKNLRGSALEAKLKEVLG